MASRLIVGCGYVGTRVASKWLKNGDTVFAITRSHDRAQQLSLRGIKPIVWDWLVGGTPFSENAFQISGRPASPFETILIAVSHASQPDVPHDETHTRGLNHFEMLLKSPNWMVMMGYQTKWIYLSTTGVFIADTAGDWVDEETEVLPERPGSIAAWGGEQWLTTHVSMDQRVTLRPAGIYGPERVPRWQSIRDQIPLPLDPESFLNLIHVDDLAAAIVKISDTKMKSALYCISDGAPVRRRDYYDFIAKLGRWPNPIFEDAKPKVPGAPSLRSDGNKRVSNHRLQSELGMELQYASYREGLADLLKPGGE